MKRILSTVLLFCLVLSCQNKDAELDAPSGDFIKDILVYYNNSDKPITKYQFQNDGTNYTNVALFTKRLPSDLFQPEPQKIISFEYDESGFIAKIDEKTSVDAYAFSSYVYKLVDGVLIYEEYLLKRIGFEKGDVERNMYFNNPEDGFYEFEDKLYEFENGNLIVLGTINEVDGGDLNQFDKNWNVSDKYYDNNPNVYANPAINFVLGDKKMLRSLNRNNLTGIKERGENGPIPKIDYIYNGNKIESIINYETGAIAQFIY